MLSIRDLRFLCTNDLQVKPTFKTLLLTSLKYERKELESIFYMAEIPISKFINVINDNNRTSAEEERLLIEVIKSESNPNVLHLIKYLCESNAELFSKLKNVCPNIIQLQEELILRINRSHFKNNILDSQDLNDPLLRVETIRKN